MADPRFEHRIENGAPPEVVVEERLTQLAWDVNRIADALDILAATVDDQEGPL